MGSSNCSRQYQETLGDYSPRPARFQDFGDRAQQMSEQDEQVSHGGEEQDTSPSGASLPKRSLSGEKLEFATHSCSEAPPAARSAKQEIFKDSRMDEVSGRTGLDGFPGCAGAGRPPRRSCSRGNFHGQVLPPGGFGVLDLDDPPVVDARYALSQSRTPSSNSRRAAAALRLGPVVRCSRRA